MSELETEMTRVVQDFISQISQLARRAAISTLEAALGGPSVANAQTRDRGTGAAGQRVRQGGRRGSTELAELQNRILAHIKSNPGLRTEQINAALGTTTKDLARPVRKLIEEGALKTKGERRGTQYFAR